MSRFRAMPYPEQSEINLSPMLDVVFIMLIFFIVVASFVDEVGLDVTMSPTVSPAPPTAEAINVVVTADGLFIVNGRVLEAQNLQPYVQALHGENPEASYGVMLEKASVVADAAVAVEAGRRIGVEVVPLTAAQ